jgi:hypothetical protein
MPLTEKQIVKSIATLLNNVTFDLVDTSKGFQRNSDADIKSGRAPRDFAILKRDYLNLKSHIAGLEGRPTGEDYRLLDGSNGLGALGYGYGSDNQDFTYNNRENLKSLLRGYLREIAKNEAGQQLLSQTADLAIKSDRTVRPFKIRISNYEEDEYNLNTNLLTLNPWNTIATRDQNNNVKLFSILPTIHGSVVAGTEELVESRDGLSPYFLTIAHELIHFKDVKGRCKVDPIPDYNQPPYNRLSGIIKSQSGSNKHSYYEHRAVLDGDPLDISELNIRMQAREPLRYLYQCTEGNLYEPESYVMKYAAAFAPAGYTPYVFSRISAYLNKLPKRLFVKNIDTKHTKIRLAQSRDFMQPFEETFLNNPEMAKEFVKRRTSFERRQKVLNSIEEIPRRIADVDAKIKTTKDTQLQQFLETNKRRLNAKLGRRINELSILQKMGLVTFFRDRQPSKNNPHSTRFQDAFKMLLGLKDANSDVLKDLMASRAKAPKH